MNLEESDALVGIVFLQMPTTRGRIIRLEADAFAARQSAERAEEADLILCFMASGADESGTRMLADKAIETNGSAKAVYAYAINKDEIQRVGEHDPGEIWAHLVPAA